MWRPWPTGGCRAKKTNKHIPLMIKYLHTYSGALSCKDTDVFDISSIKSNIVWFCVCVCVRARACAWVWYKLF